MVAKGTSGAAPKIHACTKRRGESKAKTINAFRLIFDEDSMSSLGSNW
jgi:hypothetical protein